MLTPRQPNILVDNSGCPRITEFGLTTTFPVSESSWICRCMRWAEPGDWIPSKKSSDVFSFVMVMVKVHHRCWPQTNCWPIYPPPWPRFLPEKFHSFWILNLKWCQLWNWGNDWSDTPTRISQIIFGHWWNNAGIIILGTACHELAFFTFFSPYLSLELTIFIRSDLILSTPLRLFQTISPAHSVHR